MVPVRGLLPGDAPPRGPLSHPAPAGHHRRGHLPGAPNEVWCFGEEDYEICKKYMFLRERLRPYIKEQMAAAHEKGTPVMRPLFYDFPGDSAAWACEDAYLFGPSLLVAPVMEAGQRQLAMYLPAGAQWTHVWSGETYEGGQTVTVAAPLEEIPCSPGKGFCCRCLGKKSKVRSASALNSRQGAAAKRRACTGENARARRGPSEASVKVLRYVRRTYSGQKARPCP